MDITIQKLINFFCKYQSKIHSVFFLRDNVDCIAQATKYSSSNENVLFYNLNLSYNILSTN